MKTLILVLLLFVAGCTYDASDIEKCITQCEVNGGIDSIGSHGCLCKNGAEFRQ
jgi:hypothetical protein